MLLNDFDECKTSTFDPEEVQNVILNFPKIAVGKFRNKDFFSFFMLLII